MRVLHILEATAGGTRRHILDLLPALTQRGVDCSLIYSPLRNPAFEQDAALLRTLKIETFCVPMSRGWNSAIDLHALHAIRSLLGKTPFDIIHAHSSKAGFLGRLAAGPSRKNAIVYTPHCIAMETGLPHPQKRLARYIEKMLAPLTGQYIAVSEAEKRTLLRAGLASPGKVHLIYNGIRAQQDNPTTSPASTFTIGCFGRLSPQKNQKFVLHLLHHLRQQAHDISLLLVGDGTEADRLQLLARQLRLQDAVRWIGDVPNPLQMYARCHAVIQPSRWEGCPYSVLEAMAAARPVLASPAGAMPQLLAGHGQVEKLSEMDRWIKTLLLWRDDAELREGLGNKARERAEKDFSLGEMVERTLGVYGLC